MRKDYSPEDPGPMRGIVVALAIVGGGMLAGFVTLCAISLVVGS